MSDSPAVKPDFYCCDFSEQAGEQLFGTAVRVNVWLALEYARPWGGDAFATSDIAEPVKQHVNGLLAAIPKSRLQLIRQPARTGSDIALYVAVSREVQPVLYEFQLNQYEDLLSLDIPLVASGHADYERNISHDPLFLVCANGKRNISCAKYGRPVYDAMAQLAGQHVWHTTHLGGHRFAATAVFLPHGLCYGRMRAGDVPRLVEEFRQGQITPEHYRGASYYDEPVQAAEYFLRMQTGNRQRDAYHCLRARQDEQSWTVRWEDTQDGRSHEIKLIRELSPFEVYKSSADVETTRVPQFRLSE